MNLQEYTQEVKNKIMIQCKYLSESEINKGIGLNSNFIKDCFEIGYSVNHVVHELTLL